VNAIIYSMQLYLHLFLRCHICVVIVV
jgi:hypothetical protein